MTAVVQRGTSMALTDEEQELLLLLERRLSRARSEIRKNEEYYDGALRLQALGLSLPPEMRQLQVVMNWPRLYVDTIEERLDIEGFRVPGQRTTDDRLWRWWQENDMDEESSLAHIESLVQGHSYICVGFNEEDPETPIYTVETASTIAVELDPRTRKLQAAARFYEPDSKGTAGRARRATLYLPDRNIYLTRERANRIGAPWDVEDVDQHDLDEVLVIVMANRPRLRDRRGRSQMDDIKGLTDAACRALTNLQGAQEFHAIPSRWVFGGQKEDFIDRDGNPVSPWQAYIGRLNMLSDPAASIVQLPASDLNNFGNVLTAYSKLVASVTGLPPHYLGYASDNPASAEAIRSSEARIIKQAERHQRSRSGPWEQMNRLGALVVDGRVPDEWKRLETMWRDPGTPTFTAKAAAIAQLVAAGIMPIEEAWEQLGYSQDKIKELSNRLKGGDPLQQLLEATSGAAGPSENQAIKGNSPIDRDKDGLVNEP